MDTDQQNRTPLEIEPLIGRRIELTRRAGKNGKVVIYGELVNAGRVGVLVKSPKGQVLFAWHTIEAIACVNTEPVATNA